MATLKEFMKGTLNEIVDALNEFQDEQVSKGSCVTPFPLFNPSDGLEKLNVVSCQVTDSDGRWAYYPVIGINFDVAVEATQATKSDMEGHISGKLGFKVVGSAELSGSGGKHSEDSNSSTNRISFSVPVMLPPDSRLLKASMEWNEKQASLELAPPNIKG